MSDMDLKKAREILKPYAAQKQIPYFGMGEAHRVLEADAFMRGHASRDPEVEKLKATIEWLRDYLPQPDRLPKDFEITDLKKLVDELSAEREASKKLVDAGKALRTWAVAYNEQIANGGRAASGAIAEFDDALKLYATPQASWSWPLQGGHSPEGKDVA